MPEFRTIKPNRKKVPNTVSKYSEHMTSLKEDFNSRCGYCNDLDKFRLQYFEIDHFVPKVFLNKISITEYSNLVYSCRSCNNSKSNKWPTKNELVHNNYDTGWIDPCDAEYDIHFQRSEVGEIIPITNLGNWMFKELKLYKPQHQINWSLEQLDEMIDELAAFVEKDKDNLPIRDSLIDIYRKYREFRDQLSKL